MKIVQLVLFLVLSHLFPVAAVAQIVPDSASASGSTVNNPDSLDIKDYYDWNSLSDVGNENSRHFRGTLNDNGLLKGVSDFMWQNSGFFAHSRGGLGSAWYGSLTGLNPRYLIVYMQGRPMRNARKGKYDLSLLHEYNLTETTHGTASDTFQKGEPSIGNVSFFIRPEFKEVNKSEFIIKRGRGDFDDVNVVLTRRLSNKSSLLIQGLIRDQLELNSFSDLKYNGRKIFFSYERRLDKGWLTSYSLGHTFRRILLSGPIESSGYGYNTVGSLREVAFDHTLTLKSADGRSELTAYLSTTESKRFDGNRFSLNNTDTFSDLSLSYYYGGYLKQRLFKIGGGGFYAGYRSELHNVDKTDIDGYKLQNLQRSYAFLSQKFGSDGFLSLELNEGINSDSQFGSDVVYSGELNLKFSERMKLAGELSKSVVDVPVDFQFMNTVNFSFNSSLRRESLSTVKTEFVYEGQKLQIRAAYRATDIRNPMMVTIVDPTDSLLEVTVIDDYRLPTFSGELGIELSNAIKLGISGWQNLNYDPLLPFARKYKAVAYGSIRRKFFKDNLDFSFHGERLLIGEGNRITYDPALDFFIITGGKPSPSISLINYWFIARISTFSIFLRNDNLLQTDYELVDGFGLFGNDFFWGIKWDFIN